MVTYIRLITDDHIFPIGTIVESYEEPSKGPRGTLVYSVDNSYVWVVPDESNPYKETFAGVIAERGKDTAEDTVNHPRHYTSHPSGIEAIEITRHYGYSIGNAIKYLWRAGLKKDEGQTVRDKEIEDLEKAAWYIEDRIQQLKGGGR